MKFRSHDHIQLNSAVQAQYTVCPSVCHTSNLS